MLLPKHSKAITELAQAFYDFLPGSGHARWTNHTTFASVASKCDISAFWPGGSKTPAIITLLSKTYDLAPSKFELLILSIINEGISYRDKNKKSVSREEIEKINKILLRLERKFPYLWDKEFLENLPSIVQAPPQDARQKHHIYQYDAFKKRFYNLYLDENRQLAGRKFEDFIYDLFHHFELKPRHPFSVQGEELDGSFELDHDIYLVEAKWHAEKIQQKDLLVFRGKIEGKSSITRGVFIAANGFTEKALLAIQKGKQPIFFLIDGTDINNLLCYKQDLLEMLRFKRRAMAEAGDILARF